ncbi:MAG TPA: SRPBCC family protein [Sphingobacteriaceae bacterium]
METVNKSAITVKTTVKAPVSKVWEFWNEPEHIKNWCFASDDWHAPHAENDLQVGKGFTTTMAARDGSMSFDFGGVYTSVIPQKEIAYTMDDGRKVKITFTDMEGETKIEETFDPESENSEEMQRSGWQAILDNFKKYTEAN